MGHSLKAACKEVGKSISRSSSEEQVLSSKVCCLYKSLAECEGSWQSMTHFSDSMQVVEKQTATDSRTLSVLQLDRWHCRYFWELVEDRSRPDSDGHCADAPKTDLYTWISISYNICNVFSCDRKKPSVAFFCCWWMVGRIFQVLEIMIPGNLNNSPTLTTVPIIL